MTTLRLYKNPGDTLVDLKTVLRRFPPSLAQVAELGTVELVDDLRIAPGRPLVVIDGGNSPG